MSNIRKFLAIVILLAGAIGLFVVLNNAGSTILVSESRAVQVSDKMYAIYLNMENVGQPDTILDVVAKDAEKAFVMGVEKGRALAIPQSSKPSFSSDGAHIMVQLKASELRDGEFIPYTLSFKNAGAINVKAVVRSPKQMKSADMSMEDKDSEMDHSMHGKDSTMEMKSGHKTPKIDISVTEGYDKNWVVNLTTKNFEFYEPETNPPSHKMGQGHGHLYLNGLKLQRMYSKTATVGTLPPGKHIISITLNTNDHKAYSVDSLPLSASFEIEIK